MAESAEPRSGVCDDDDATLAGIAGLARHRVPRGFGELRQIWFGLNGAERNVFTHSRSIKRGIETHHGGAQWRLIR